MPNNGSRHLKPEDLRGRRWRGLVRESTVEQAEQWSPDRQRSDLRRAADELGLVPAEPLFYERTGSGEAVGAPEIERALADARRGEYDVLLVLHTSRLARNVEEARRLKAEARRIGLVVYFTAQRLLSGSRTGSLMEGLNEVLDEHGNAERRFWIAGGHRERQLAGRWLGNVPAGYRKRLVDRPDGTRGWDGALEADPDHGPVVRRIFKQFAAGESPRSIATGFNAEGLRTPEGNPWRRAGIVKILRNPAYKGLLVRYRESRPDHYYPEADPHDGQRTMRGSWEPIVSEAMFDQVQVLLDDRAVRGSAHLPHRRYPLSLVLRCVACGRGMTGASNGYTRYYRCHGRVEMGVCPAPYIRAETAEGAFADWLNGFRLPDDWREAFARRRRKAPKTDIQAKKEHVTAAIARLRKMFEWGDMPEAEYRAEMAQLRSELATTVEAPQADLERYAEALREMGTDWADAPMEKQAAVARLFLDSATVREGEVVEWVVRAAVRPVLEECVARDLSLYAGAVQSPVRYTA